ncbi:hypothetical protein PAPYR_7138 [Paratrimastix pyriformis]|uniref:Uncharacterized protein n=1 Tax=Paratrimastix pyriformis TaxID=342808 RepID=A0ABQ8UGC7_9EUKA|nr:hypothetical protein PAPYR_7138 [Paratrimastix pyriformis]
MHGTDHKGVRLVASKHLFTFLAAWTLTPDKLAFVVPTFLAIPTAPPRAGPDWKATSLHSAIVAANVGLDGKNWLYVQYIGSSTIYRQFTVKYTGSFTDFLLAIQKSSLWWNGRDIPNLETDPTEYGDYVNMNANLGMGYERQPKRVYTLSFPYEETWEHDVNLGVFRAATSSSQPILHITLKNATTAQMRLHVLFIYNRIGEVSNGQFHLRSIS